MTAKLTISAAIPVSWKSALNSALNRSSRRAGALFDDTGTAVACDSSGNSYVTGYFYDSVDLGGGPLTSPGGWDSFLVKYQP